MKALGARSLAAALLAGLALATGCGGGGSTGGAPNPTQPITSTLAITTTGTLPGAVQGAAYHTTVTATGGAGTLRWSMNPASADGLTIDGSTGTISGQPTTVGSTGFTVSVSDGVKTVSKFFFVPVYSTLTAANLTTSVHQYGAIYNSLPLEGGVPPLTYTVSSGSLPGGVKLDLAYRGFAGSPLTTGVFQSTVVVHDSYSPPQTATMQLNVTVMPPYLTVGSMIPARLPLNRPFTGKIVADGGTPPYTFSISGGPLPPGLNLTDATIGEIGGTPTTAGQYSYAIQVTDSSSPPQGAQSWSTTTIAAARGRNDSIETATPFGNGWQSASISPYVEPPPTATAGDQDFYKVTAIAGTPLHVETTAKRQNSGNSLDTVLEILDGNGQRLNWCNPPNTTGNFTSPCINDDISATPHVQDSALELNMPGPANATAPVYVHVLDWRGDARPDMSYNLSISGSLAPLAPVGQLNSPMQRHAGLGQATSFPLHESGGVPPYSWAVTAGNLPPGMALSPAGVLSGTPTAVGNYAATLTVTDSELPPQHASDDFTVTVETPPQITTVSLPDIHGWGYTQSIAVTDGTPPYSISINAAGLYGMRGGVADGVPFIQYYPVQTEPPGIYQLTITITDSAGLSVSKTFTVALLASPLVATDASLFFFQGHYSAGGIGVSGGTPPYNCSLSSGTLPAGMAANVNYCWISGTPTAAGSYAITVQVNDSAQPPQTTTATMTLTIRP